MLHDPKRANPSLANFIAWLETKDQRKRYDFLDTNGKCLMGQHMTAMGIAWNGANYDMMCTQVLGQSALVVLDRRPRTFGGALKRARACLAQS